MYPVLVEIGGFTITTFGLMMFLAFIVGALVLGAQLERRGFERELAWDMLLGIMIGGVVGAKLYYLALHWQDLVADPLRELTSRGGLVWYGGLIGGVLAYAWQVRRRGLPLAPMFDATAPALMIAIALGRIGCFLVGDDYGLPTDSWVGVAFPQGAPPSTAGYLRSIGAEVPLDVPDSAVLAVHPTQLYEVAIALVLFGVLWKLSPRLRRPGRLFGLYLALYAVERFLIEFLRAKDDRLLLGLSTSQMLSVVLIGVAAYLWMRPGGARAAVAARASGAAE
ncbi:MAG TPA: prolipoprotein diacylglyceryl transferase [Longimicrobiales bacterium]